MSVLRVNEVKDIKAYLSTAVRFAPVLKHVDTVALEKAAETGVNVDASASDLLSFLAETAASFTFRSYEYSQLAGRLEMIDLYTNTNDSFTAAMKETGVLLPEFLKKIEAYDYDQHIKGEDDFSYDIIGVRTLKRSYLLQNKDGKIVERPQYMLMRVAVFLNDDVESVVKTYNALREKYYTHASPTLFNSGCLNHQLASCFLLPVEDDSLDGIYNTLSDCAQISKMAGGIGFSCSNVRAKGSLIKTLNGKSDGLVPMLKVYNHTARYVNQGGKRKGAFASYLEPWHADVEDWLELKLNHGDEEARARDLFFALWVPDNFMRAVEKDEWWYLMCPSKVKGLQDAHGEAYEKLYEEAVEKKLYNKKVKARQLWGLICRVQIETGGPYVLYKDSVNAKSNQKNLGTIRSGNLCAEVTQFNSKDETAVCTLASICLPRFFIRGEFDFKKLRKAAYLTCKNLNKVIDKTSYPIEKARVSNFTHRPLGIGVQGLADVFQRMGLPYSSQEALELNERIFETIYFGAMSCSIDLAEKNGPYASFTGSPLSEGKFQFDLWGVEPKHCDWATLRERLEKFGAVNSLLTACMPTASTAQINGNTESFEPCTSNLYVRRVLSGEFMVVNRNLEAAARKLGLWNEELVNQIIKDKGRQMRVGRCNLTFHCTPKSMFRQRKRRA